MATVKSSENMPVLLLSVAFAPGEVAKIIEVPLLDDHLDSDAPNEDEEETFNLEITDNTGAPVTTAVGTILDDDPIVANFIYPYAVVLDEPARIDEGETFTIQGRVTDTADSTNVTVVLDMDLNFDGDTNDSGESVQVHSGLTGTAFTHTSSVVADDGPSPGNASLSDALPITGTATDTQGGSDSHHTSLLVNNVDPTVTIDGAPETSVVGTEISLNSTVVDLGTSDLHTYAWSVKKDGAECFSGTDATFSFTPTDAGIYLVQLTVTDDDGGEGTDDIEIMLFGPDIDTDSNNTGVIGDEVDGVPEEDIEEDEAKRIFVNKDDDNKNGIPDGSPQDGDVTITDNDFAKTRLDHGLPAGTDFSGMVLRLTLQNGLDWWPGSKISQILATAPSTILDNGFEIPLDGSADIGGVPVAVHSLFPAHIFIEGLETGDRSATLELVNNGTVAGDDVVKYSVETIVWPSNESGDDWQDNPTSEWDGFVLGDGWWIENSLFEIINGNVGSIRTRFPEQQDSGYWQGTGQYEDTYIPIPKDGDGDFLNSFTINVSYEFENAPDGRSINNFVDTTHDYLKPGFFCNSGLKIDGKTEVQIFDSASLFAAVDDPLTSGDPGVQVLSDDVPPAPNNRIWARYAENGHDVHLAKSEGGSRPAGWAAENFSALINGAAYGVPRAKDENNVTLIMDEKEEFEAASVAGSMTIHVLRHDVDRGNNSALYDLEVIVGARTYKYADLPGTGNSGPGAAVSDTIVLQSHWGSGVKFTAFRIE